MKQKTIFDIINDICFNKIHWKDQLEMDKKVVQPYMINRWLSMSTDYLDLIAEVQPLTDLLTTDQYYEFYRDILPKKKFFVKYVKSQIEKDEKNKNLIEFLAKFFQLSQREVEDMIKIIDKKELGNIIQSCGFSDKEIKSQFGIGVI